MKYNTFTLPNGLRIIHRPFPSEVAYCGYCIATGSRHELATESGMAHYCEHLSFKGTGERSARQIINCLENRGGDLNAYTTKEHTTYYAALLKQDILTAIDLLSDMVFRSIYPQREAEKELEVIIDEYNSYRETPSEVIYDEFERCLFEGNPLGRNIFGDFGQLRSSDSGSILHFARSHYRPENMVFYVDGDVDFDRVVRRLEQRAVAEPLDSSYCRPATPVTPNALAQPFRHVTHDESVTHQTHCLIGNRAYSMNDSRRIALYLLNNILGGPGMSSRLNLLLREKYGLVYSVESAMVNYSDTGLWYTYFACGDKDVKRCKRLLTKELEKLMENTLSPARLSIAKRQLKGQIAVACDNRENFAIDYAKTYLYHAKEKDLGVLFEEIDSLSSAQLQAVAAEVFNPDSLCEYYLCAK